MASNLLPKEVVTAEGKLMINYCSEEDLMAFPRVGKRSAKNIADFRALHGNITEENINHIRKLTISDQLLQMVDFCPNPKYVKKSTNIKSPTDPIQIKIVQAIDKHIQQQQERADQDFSSMGGAASFDPKNAKPSRTLLDQIHAQSDLQEQQDKVILKALTEMLQKETNGSEGMKQRSSRKDVTDTENGDKYDNDERSKRRTEKSRRQIYSPKRTPLRYPSTSDDDYGNDDTPRRRSGKARSRRSSYSPEASDEEDDRPKRRSERTRRRRSAYSPDDDDDERPRRRSERTRRSAYSIEDDDERPRRRSERTWRRRLDYSPSEDDDDTMWPRRRSDKTRRRRPAYSPRGTPSRYLPTDSEADEDLDDIEWKRPRRATKTSERSGFKPSALPKSLTFNGKSNWLAFKRKFTRYATAAKWTEEECLDALCWCLTDKASDFYALVTERRDDMTYFELLRKLEKRFGQKELPETAHARFLQATQTSDEELEDWADRAQTLANKAFKGLSERHIVNQAIVRFCQGCQDKEAGQAACNTKPKTMNKALEQVRWYQYTYQAIYRQGKKKPDNRVSRTSMSWDKSADHSWTRPEYEDGVDISVGSSREDGKSEKTTTTERLQKLEDNMNLMLSSIEKMATSMNKLTTRRNTRSPSPGSGCYYCGDQSHFKKDCIKFKEAKQKQEKRVSFEDLNPSGSD